MRGDVIYNKKMVSKLISDLHDLISALEDVSIRHKLNKKLTEIDNYMYVIELAERDDQMHVVKNRDYLCPKCHEMVLDMDECEDVTSAYKSTFCHNCGQRLDWSFIGESDE